MTTTADNQNAVPPVLPAGSESLPPRERILLAARELFYRRGIHAVGVDALAEAALTNKMTLYRHFGSKDDLVVAYATQLAADGDAVWRNLAVSCEGDPDRHVEAWIAYVHDVVTNRFERGCALANAAVELQPGHPARAVIEDYKQRKRRSLVSMFDAARYRDPEGLADEVFLLFEGARISLQCGQQGPALRLSARLREMMALAPKRPRGRQG